MHSVVILLLLIFANYTKGNKQVMDEFVKPSPHFRWEMEESFDDQVHQSVDEPSDNLVSFLVDNVKELFFSSDNITTTYKNESLDPELLLVGSKTSDESLPALIAAENFSLFADDLYLPFLRAKIGFDNLKPNGSHDPDEEVIDIFNNVELTKNVIEKDRVIELKRTCIACNNELHEHCSFPKTKHLPSVVCQREDDVCYSLHTPFGIIDRGCFNINHNVSLFVCACNLCNYISLSEMPYKFSNKRDWVQNVVELSRTRRFRESIFKDMSCLSCEATLHGKRGAKLADIDCLEGNITTIHTKICTADEICGVKAIRSQGYVWRGCISEPLYNYWWRFCDKDFCNDDPLISIYG